MSSEGSVTSSTGIRQFGLYRTIDARTEEFLRLSRKRQIRQGCACAAISTAITVTVVVSIILIYEYSISYESNSKSTLKPNWLSLMNKTADAIPFEAKLNKAKINLDPVYFLPLILKTLKKNIYFDKIIEEDSTQNPIYDKQENTYTKNIFSDTRNWMRAPTSRLYAIEYKTSPMVYFKYPTRNIDHFTKVRRIRDYQRIRNYIDKMISERVTYGSTIPMKNTYGFHRKSITTESTTPMTKVIDYITKKHKTTVPQPPASEKKANCRCPKHISELLSKLITSLQKLIPHFISNEQMASHFCNKNNKDATQIITKTMITPKIYFKEKCNSDHICKSFNNSLKNNNTKNLKASNQQKNFEISGSNVSVTERMETPKIKFVSSTTDEQTMQYSMSKTFYSLKPNAKKIDNSVNSPIQLLKPSMLIHKTQDNSSNYFTTTTKEFIDGTEANYFFQKYTTKPMSKSPDTTEKYISSIKTPPNTLTTVQNFIFGKGGVNDTIKYFLTYPTFNDSEYDDYNIDTTPNSINSFNNLDAHSIELVKNKLIAARNEGTYYKNPLNQETLNKLRRYTSADGNESEFYNKTWNILRKVGKLAIPTTEPEDNNYDTNLELINTKTTTTAEIGNEKEIFNSNTESTKPINIIQKLTQSYLTEHEVDLPLKIEDITLEEEVDKPVNDDLKSEDDFKSLETMITKLNSTEIYSNAITTENSELNQWELAKIKELRDNDSKENKQLKSMIPENRPSYLEIQRNDWKHAEHQDYDNNGNNNFFE